MQKYRDAQQEITTHISKIKGALTLFNYLTMCRQLKS